jgi:hypothetical protein
MPNFLGHKGCVDHTQDNLPWCIPFLLAYMFRPVQPCFYCVAKQIMNPNVVNQYLCSIINERKQLDEIGKFAIAYKPHFHINNPLSWCLKHILHCLTFCVGHKCQRCGATLALDFLFANPLNEAVVELNASCPVAFISV